MASSAQRSSYINLYSVEDVTDNAYKLQLENKQAKIALSGASDFEMDFPAYKFVKADDSVFDLETRFAALESDNSSATNATAITQLQVDLAAEQVARQSADTSNSNLITAEVNNRTTAVQGVQSAVDAEAVTARAAEAANASAISSEESARISAVAAEASRAQAAEVALGVRIDNVLSNADPASLDSLSELLSAFQSADNSLQTSITNALARIQTLEDQVSELTSA